MSRIITMPRVISMTVLFSIAMLFALVSNLYQPTMEFNLHCTVHNRLIEAFGGQCDAGLGMSLFTSIAAIFGTSVALFIVATFFSRAAHIFLMALVPANLARVRIAASPPRHLANYYQRGIAQTRRFL